MLSDPWIRSVLEDEVREGCRDWPFRSLNKDGYPVVKIGGRQGRVVPVSHVMLERSGQPRPPGKEALHACDRPICCALWHLRWGTRSENIADALGRNRWPTGERCYAAKVSDEQAEAIRLDGRNQYVIAAEYKISQSSVSRIKARKRYNNPNNLYW